jgi:acetyl esterase
LTLAFVGAAECDPSRDDAEEFVRKSKDAGGVVFHKRYAGMIHGFMSGAGFLPTAQEGGGDVSTWLKQRFEE